MNAAIDAQDLKFEISRVYVAKLRSKSVSRSEQPIGELSAVTQARNPVPLAARESFKRKKNGK